MRAAGPARADAGGFEIRVRVTPRGGRDAVDRVETLSDGRQVLKMRVRAAPENGAAKEAVRRLIAATLEISPTPVSLTAGATARTKTFRMAGDALAALTLESP